MPYEHVKWKQGHPKDDCCRIPNLGNIGHAASLGRIRGYLGIRRGRGTVDLKALAITLQFMVLRKKFEEEMRLVAGQWCGQTTTRKKSRERLKEQSCGHDCGAFELHWSVHHPY